MAVVDFLQHENPSTWTGVEPASWVQKASDKSPTPSSRQEKYSGETSPNVSTITCLVQRFRDTGSVADKKQSGRASIVKTKVADVETALQRSPMKRPPVYINIITEFISLLNSNE
ncbi:DUF4817 domain-containing protein [Trichonephila clavipes]|nr:DUF4817 domain-containing protein [Trichonephila clavipes]